jgi:methyl-accepting chemotaxis protein
MPRALFVAVVVTGSLLVAGCGGDDGADTGGDVAGGDRSELCQSLEDLQDTVRGIGDIELGEDTVDVLRQTADQLNADLAAVEEAAGDELGDEVDAVETALEDLSDELESIAADGELTTESVTALAGPISSAASAFETLARAAPDCNL